MIIFFLGKGTQCDRIAKVKTWHIHLSVGDLLREEIDKSDSDLGKEISNTMKNGSLIPAKINCKLIENVSIYNEYLTLCFSLLKTKRKSGKENALIDGFPRDKDNINKWKRSMADKVNMQCVLDLDCDEKVMNLFIVFILEIKYFKD